MYFKRFYCKNGRNLDFLVNLEVKGSPGSRFRYCMWPRYKCQFGRIFFDFGACYKVLRFQSLR